MPLVEYYVFFFLLHAIFCVTGLWGGEGVIRGHTYVSEMKETPMKHFMFNQTWWPERYYNYELKSLLLGQVKTFKVHVQNIELICI